MWGSLVFGALTRPWARQTVGFALTALTIALFILTFATRPSALAAPPSGWKTWNATMIFNARCWTPPAAVLVIAMVSLSACERAGSDKPGSVCPPVVDYSIAEQAKVADEIAALPENARIVDWLADYAVLRDQARACEW